MVGPAVGLGAASFFSPLFLTGASAGGPAGAMWQRLDFWWLCFNNKSCSGFYSFDVCPWREGSLRAVGIQGFFLFVSCLC